MTNQVLARKQSVVAVSRCAHGCIHVQFGRINITLTETEYMELVALINESAANYELMRLQDSAGLDETDSCRIDRKGDSGCDT